MHVSAKEVTAKVFDRGRGRYERAAMTSLTNIAGRAIMLLTSMATIPMVLQHVGQERFGLWMTVTSLTALFGFADLGIGNGVLNAVAEANGRDDIRRVRAVVSSALVMLTLIAVAILLVSAVVVPRIDWSGAFGITGDIAADEAPKAIAVFVVFLSASIPASVAMRVQMGLQQGYVVGAWQTAGSVAGLIGVLLTVRVGGGLPWLLAAFLGGPLVAAVLNSIVFFAFARPDLRPHRQLASGDLSRTLLRLGGLFFVLQITASLAFASDNVIAARMLGAAAVSDFAVATRLFGITSVLVGILLQPLWPAYGEAIARRDIAWVHRTLRATTIGAVFFAATLSALILSTFGSLTHLWLHRELQVSWILLSGLAIWTVVEAAGNSLSMFLNGAHIVGIQVVLASALAMICVGLKVFAVNRMGVAGLPWAMIASYCTITLLPVSLLLKRVVAKL
jgi:O-antigen/teichoic acid export membrane protein